MFCGENIHTLQILCQYDLVCTLHTHLEIITPKFHYKVLISPWNLPLTTKIACDLLYSLYYSENVTLKGLSCVS